MKSEALIIIIDLTDESDVGVDDFRVCADVTDTSRLVERKNGFEVKGQGASCLLHALKRFGLPEK